MIEFTNAGAVADLTAQELKKLEREVKKAERMALNKTVSWTRTRVGRIVREEYTVKAAPVRDAIKTMKAVDGVARVQVKGSPIPLYKFNATPRKAQTRGRRNRVVRVEVKRGARKPLPGAFVANIKGVPRIMRRKGRPRLPIMQLYGPSAPSMADNPKVWADLKKSSYERYAEELIRVLNYLRGKL